MVSAEPGSQCSTNRFETLANGRTNRNSSLAVHSGNRCLFRLTLLLLSLTPRLCLRPIVVLYGIYTLVPWSQTSPSDRRWFRGIGIGSLSSSFSMSVCVCLCVFLTVPVCRCLSIYMSLHLVLCLDRVYL